MSTEVWKSLESCYSQFLSVVVSQNLVTIETPTYIRVTSDNGRRRKYSISFRRPPRLNYIHQP
jgi:hypothetical protein